MQSTKPAYFSDEATKFLTEVTVREGWEVDRSTFPSGLIILSQINSFSTSADDRTSYFSGHYYDAIIKFSVPPDYSLVDCYRRLRLKA